MTPPGEVAHTPDVFLRALASLRSASIRPEVALEERSAPRQLAPHAIALAARVVFDGAELACGHFIMLHDPAGQQGWDGTFRIASYVRAELDSDMVTDPLLAGVGWSWLTDALEAQDASYAAPGGTITRSASESFGAIADLPASTEIEMRASWTPLGADLASHLQAWCVLLCTVAGLPPLPSGVASLRRWQQW
ncbi:MAG: DUF3000 domain-containing protein [Streptosporangiaceae bacterium]